jgi:formylglycine-generating enzyme required for sulfatase activity
MKNIVTCFVFLTFFISSCDTDSRTTSEDVIQSKPLRGLTRIEPTSFSNAQLALVIGNSQYEHNSLANISVNDADDMAPVLEQLGFNVTKKTNLTQEAMDNAINEFGKRLPSSGGIGLFYFAGHGVQVNGKNYLLPINNNRIQNANHLKYHAVDVDKILVTMKDARNNLNIIILDACRDNPYRSAKRSLQRGLAAIEPSSGSIIAYATAPGKTAANTSKGGRNGLYTKYLLKVLKTAQQKPLRLEDIFMQVRNGVFRESNKDQEPWYASSLNSPFCFGGCQMTVEQVEAPLKAPFEKISQDALKDGSLGHEMVVIPTGSFKMYEDAKPTYIKSFAIGKYEVTFAEYDAFITATGGKEPNDAGWGKNKRPVIYVSWQDAKKYTEWLSEQTGKTYLLPTKKEWLYAARAGMKASHHIDQNGTACNNTMTLPVGSFKPNPFGVYDTVGNVWEWTDDGKDSYSQALCGGSWNSKPDDCSILSCTLESTLGTKYYNDVGFRVINKD